VYWTASKTHISLEDIRGAPTPTDSRLAASLGGPAHLRLDLQKPAARPPL
jgi:hypothetical protein